MRFLPLLLLPALAAGQPARFRAADVLPAAGPVRQVALADCNGDGLLDLITAAPGSLSVQFSRGDGTFGAAQTWPSVANPAALITADLNHDGRTDIVVADAGGAVETFIGQPDGTFVARQTVATGSDPVALAVGVWSQSGNPDLVIADRAGNRVLVLPGNGDGTFRQALPSIYAEQPSALLAADWNSDGVTDIAVANFAGNRISILSGSTEEGFREIGSFATGIGPSALARGDFNHDGFADLAVLTSGGKSIGIYTGNGKGSFQAAEQLPLAIAAGALAAADTANRGTADLIVTDAFDGGIRILEGTGNGGFATPNLMASGHPGIGARAIALGDVNRDGRIDVATSGAGGSAQVLLSLHPADVPAPVYTFAAPAAYVGPAAGSGSVLFAATPLSTSWTGSSDSSWLHLTTTTGTGGATLQYTYDSNAGATRTGNLTIGGSSYAVTQMAAGAVQASQTSLQIGAAAQGYGVAADNLGNVYYSEQSNKLIRKFNGISQQLTTPITGLQNPMGLALDAAGNVYIADGGLVRKWTAATQQLSTLVTLTGDSATYVAVDAGGNVYYTRTIASPGVWVWNPNTQQTSLVFSTPTPHQFAVAPSGDIYFADGANIQKWTAATQQLSTIISNIGNLFAVAMDGSGNLYIGQGGLAVWNASTQQITSLISSGYTGAIAVNGAATSIYSYQSQAPSVLVYDQVWLTPTSFSFPYTGGTGVINITPYSNARGYGTVNTFVTVNSVTSTTINFTAGLNHYVSPQTGDVEFLGQYMQVTEAAGVPGAPAAIAKTAGDNQSGLVNQTFGTALQATVTDQYGNPVPGAGVTFTAVAGAGGATGAFTGSTTVTTDANGVATAPALTAGAANGAFTVTGAFSGGSVVFNLTIVAPVFTLATPSGYVAATAGSGSVFLVANVEQANWTASSNASWLHFSAGNASGTGSGPVIYTFDANASGAARSGSLTVAGQTFTVTQVGTGWVASSTSVNTLVTDSSYALGIAMDSAGNLYYAGEISQSIRKWTRATGAIADIVTGYQAPNAVALDAQGNVYFSDVLLGQVFKWTASTQQVTTLSTPPVYSPSGLAVDGSGNVYIADSYYNEIFEWNASTQQTSTFISSAAGLNSPSGLSFDPAGNLYIADSGDNAVKKWNHATNTVTVVATAADTVNGVGVDGYGNVYYTGWETLSVLNAATGQTTTQSKVNTAFWGLAVDPAGSGAFYSDPAFGTLEYIETAWAGPSPLNEPAAGGTDTIPILPPSAYAPTATSDQTSFLTVTGISSTGVGISLTPNVVTSSRSGHVTVLGGQVTVTQAAALPGPPATVTKTAGDNQGVGANAVFGTALKVKVTDSNGNAVPGASVTFAVVPGVGGAGASFTGSATIQTDSGGAATAPTLTANGATGAFTVTATAGSASATFNLSVITVTYSLGASSEFVGAAAGSAQALVRVSPSTGGWTASSNATWLHTTASGTGSGTAPFTYDANTNPAPRTGTLSISGQTFTVTQAGASYLQVNGANTAVVTSGLSSPTGLVMDGQGNLYIADTTNKALKKWTASTNIVTTVVSTGTTSAPNGLAIDAAGNIYIADATAKAILKWNGTALSTVVSTGLSGPNAVAVDGSGNVYIADASTLKLWNGSLSTLVSSGLSTPRGLAIDATGTLYVADTGNNALKKWNGTALTSVLSGTSTIRGPIGLAADGLGNFYYSDATSGSNAVKRWNSQTGTVTAFTGFSTPKGIAVDPAGSSIFCLSSGNNQLIDTEFAWITPASFSEPAAGATDNLTIVPSTVFIKPSSDQNWLTVPTIFSGSFSFTAAANVSIGRTAHISLLGQSLTVTQAAPPPGAIASVIKTAGDNQSSAVGAAFLTALKVQVTDANAIPEPSVTVTFTVNPGAGGAGAAFTNTTTITTDANGFATAPSLIANAVAGGFTVSVVSGSVTATFNLTNATPSFVLGGSSAVVAATAGSGTVAIGAAPLNGIWSASSDSVWLHIALSGATNPVSYTFDANSGISPRTGNLTIGGRSFAVTQAGSTDLSASSSANLVTTGNASLVGGVALDGLGNVYFVDTGHKQVKKVSINGGAATTVVSSGLTSPYGLAMDASGNLYMSDPTSIKKWTASSGVVSILVSSGISAGEHVALDSAGNIYIADQGAADGQGALKKWNGTTLTTLAGGYHDVIGVAVDPAGNVCFTDTGTGTASDGALYRWNATTQQVTTLLTGLAQPGGIGFDGLGNLYIGMFGSKLIVEMNPAGQVTTVLSGTLVPEGVAADATGNNIYYSDQTGLAIRKASTAFVGPAALTELAAAGSDSVHVLPATMPFTATSDQTWLTAGTQTGGVQSFSFAANTTGASRSGHVTILGQGVSVTQNPVQTPVITWSNPSSIVQGTALSATQLNATANVPGTFAYSPAAGTVLPAGAGQTLSVTFTPTDQASYSTATASVTINVQAAPTITWNAPAAILYGSALSATQLNATANVPGTFVYSPAAGTILPAGAGQTLSVRFTPTDQANYSTATASVTINVQTVPTITWNAPAAIQYGSALSGTQLNATAGVPGTFVYTPAAGTVLPVGANQTLSVAFTPTDQANYTSAAGATTITVNAAPPAGSGININATSVVKRMNGNLVVTVTLANTGGGTANNVVLTSLKIGATAGTPLPQSIGTIAGGSSVQTTVTVPGSAGNPGAASTISITGTYTGGSFSSGGRLTLP